MNIMKEETVTLFQRMISPNVLQFKGSFYSRPRKLKTSIPTSTANQDYSQVGDGLTDGLFPIIPAQIASDSSAYPQQRL
jgi:hypothetical protein